MVSEHEIRMLVCGTCGGWHARSREEVMAKWRGWSVKQQEAAVKRLATMKGEERKALEGRLVPWPRVEAKAEEQSVKDEATDKKK